MSKTKSYFSILITAITIITIGYIMEIGSITSFTNKCLNYARNNILSVSAAICAFIFLGNKNYWLIMLACAMVIALIIQFIIVDGSIGIIFLITKAVTFIAIVFLMNFVKLLINK
jgi:hypothetical protein